MKSIVYAAVLLAVMPGCSREGSSRPLENDVYVWQRSWTDPVRAAITAAAPVVSAWRVLAAESDGKADLAVVVPDSALLHRTQKPVVAVFRINGRYGAAPLNDRFAEKTIALVELWRKNDVPVSGIELDYDCATSRLGSYRDFVRRMRARMPRGLRLSITALPSWMSSKMLPELLSEVDATVLQVHAVAAPSQGLIDRSVGLRWVQEWSHISRGPFHVALPTYWSRVSWNADGRVDAIESEISRYGLDAGGRELIADSGEVSALVAELHRAPPRNLTGITWFRLPTSQDRRAWTWRTWFSVMQGRSLQPSLAVVRLEPNTAGGMDVYLRNQGERDAELPPQVVVSAQGCEFADGLPPYTQEVSASEVRFSRTENDLLRAGEQKLVGWVRCSSKQIDAHASF